MINARAFGLLCARLLGICLSISPLLAAQATKATEAAVTPHTKTSDLASSQETVAKEASVEEAPEDADDSAQDESFWRSIVPVPIVITEPAVGEGFGLALGYFHPIRNSGAKPALPGMVSGESVDDAVDSDSTPPTITGVFGGVTNNDTQFAGIGHSTTFRDDHVRLNVIGGWANVIADIYLLDVPFEFNIEGILFYADTRMRFGDSDFFWGLGATVMDADNTFRLPLPNLPPIGLLAFDFLDVGLTGRLMYDTRDDTLFPTNGQRIDLTVAAHDKSIGGDYDYVHSRIKALTYHSLGEHLVLGGRLDVQQVDGDPPFFAVPYVALRGIPALRYQGERTAVGEVEVRYRFAERWTALAFGGVGWRKKPQGLEDDSIYNYGIGGRFKALRNRSVWIGLDIAKGPEDVYWYIQVGQAW